MKNIILTLTIAVLLIGCSKNTPRQAVIDAYKTTEIVPCNELSTSDFIVRDTNGAVWFVDVRWGDDKYSVYTSTLLFSKIKKVDKTKIEE